MAPPVLCSRCPPPPAFAFVGLSSRRSNGQAYHRTCLDGDGEGAEGGACQGYHIIQYASVVMMVVMAP